MAYTELGTIVWGSSPDITGAVAYDYRRSDANMQYRVKIVINTMPYSSSRFGYPIYASVSLDGAKKISGHQIKAASPASWSNALIYETDWLTVSNKPSGTTALRINLYSGSGESRDKNYSYSLYVVPAASTVTFGTFTMGSEGSITITRANKSYTHTITYKFGDAAGTIVTKTADTAIRWTPPLTLARQIPNTTQAVGKLTISTYSGNTKIGDKEYSFTLYVPSSVKPTAALTTTIVNSNSTIAGWNVCVQGYSSLHYGVTAGGAYGATIQSCQFSFAGKTAMGTNGTLAISNAGAYIPSVKVTDSRGRSVTVSGERIRVYEYHKPTIAKLSVQRCGELGEAQHDGTRLHVKGVFSPGASIDGRNAVTAKCRYRELNGEWSGYVTISDGEVLLDGSFLTTKTYELEVVAVDSIGEQKTVTVTVPTVEVAFNLREGGKGAAFGKYAETDTLECAWDAAFQGDVAVDGNLSLNGKMLMPRKLSNVFTADTTAASNHSVTVRYFPAFGLVILHLYVKLGDRALNANTGYNIGIINEAYRPTQQEALSIYCGKIGNATIQTGGAIRIVLANAVNAGTNCGTYITGFWFV